MQSTCIVLLAAHWLLAADPASGRKPEVSNIFPDFPCDAHRTITGEEFDPKATEVWAWDLGRREEADAAGPLPPATLPVLPAEPPKEARRITPLDVERQVLVARVPSGLVWVRTPGGCSTPYLIDVPRPFWLSEPRAASGSILYLFGFALRAEYRECRVALRSGQTAVAAKLVEPARSYRTADRNLVHFEIPASLAPGDYEVWIHNGLGGVFGWQKAGTIAVVAPQPAAPRVFDVREFGARGNDLESDFEALAAAIAAAQKAGGGEVFFPPGVWRSDATITLPTGVSLRGASRDNTILEGFGPASKDGYVTALVHLSSGTGLQSLTFQGATYKGPHAYGGSLVSAMPTGKDMVFEDLRIVNCRFYSSEVRSGELPTLRVKAIGIPPCSRVRLLDNDIHGPASFGAWFTGVYRSEFIGNTFHGGASADVVTFSANGFQCLVDSNRLVDVPGRFLFNPRRHCLIRYNEVHGAFRGTWANAEELFLVHGDTPWKTVSQATGGSPTTLTDAKQSWEPGKQQDAEVLVISGRGFGQHRTVVSNTADTLTVDQPWRVAPDATSQYVVAPMFVDNVWFANLNDTPGRMSLWLDCVGNVVRMHRDEFAGGIDVWGGDSSDSAKTVDPKRPGFYPAYYNLIERCWLDGSMVHVFSDVKAANTNVGPALFGNYVVGNHIRESHMKRTGFNLYPKAEGAIRVGNPSRPDRSTPQDARAGLSHTVVTGNSIGFTPVGVTISDFARKTFVLDNLFDHVDKPLLDWGAGTMSQGNKIRHFDEQGERTEALPAATATRENPGKQGNP